LPWADQHSVSPGFFHRVGERLVDSICLSCYLTIAAAPKSNPDCLRAAERAHHCIGSNSQGYSSIIQDSGDQAQVLAVLYEMVR
jgi:hypothetical protein